MPRFINLNPNSDEKGLSVSQTNGVSSQNAIEINNSGSGYDLRGHNGNWWIDKNGNASFISGNIFAYAFEASPSLTISYADIVNATVSIPSITAQVVMEFTLNYYYAAQTQSDSKTISMEFRTAASGGGSQLYVSDVSQNQVSGSDPMTWRGTAYMNHVVVPGSVGNYSVYARAKRTTTCTAYHALLKIWVVA